MAADNLTIAVTIEPGFAGLQRIVNERRRQVGAELYDARHDDAHTAAELARAAICYTQAAALQSEGGTLADIKVNGFIARVWPWLMSEWKPAEDPIRNLEKAGALIAAEIDRLMRLEGALVGELVDQGLEPGGCDG